MLVKYISLLPECLLILNIIIMILTHWLRKAQTPKTFMTVNKIFLSAALVGCIVFYNFEVKKSWYVNSSYTTFFKSILLTIALVINFFTGKWFINQNRSSFGYYQLSTLILLNLCLSVSCCHLCFLGGLLAICFLACCRLGYMCDNQLKQNDIKKEQKIYSIIFYIFLLGGIGIIYHQTQSLFYSDIYTYYHQTEMTLTDILGVAFIIVGIMFFLSIAPFHLWLMQTISHSILPSATYLSLILPTAGIASLITLMYTFNAPAPVKEIFLICGCLSVVLGAIGAGYCQNLRQKFACVGSFYTGIISILFSCFNEQIVQESTIYYLIYLVPMLGIYLCFYGIRRRGEYLSAVEDISGIAENKPYLSAGILIFSASFLGIPPLLGMLGNLTLIDELLVLKKYGLLLFIFIMLTVLAYGLLKLIKTMYFDKKQYNFDRIDKSVYFGLFINACLLLWVVFATGRLWTNIRIFISTLFAAGI